MKENTLLHTAFIALGSNIGNKFEYLRNAYNELTLDSKIIIEKVSSVYETKPYGYSKQDNFLNAVVKLKTDYTIHYLLTKLKKLEKKLERTKTRKWGPREIDLDLLFYDDLIYSDGKLTVPHKEILKRDFVLFPLKEIAEDFIHPALKKKISDISTSRIESTIIRKIREKLF